VATIIQAAEVRQKPLAVRYVAVSDRVDFSGKTNTPILVIGRKRIFIQSRVLVQTLS